MSYLVLARKYRPQSFDDLIGQDHIADLLKSAITSGRIGQAYLFAGPRGVGKTSCARILAKCLNDEKGPNVSPDLASSISQEIAQGRSFDVLEIDGASNRGIDEIRSLRENVKFAPSYGRYKIYIVDEVHMLTQEAFNALLKTLEEPPEHVVFIFATTAPEKLPATIISRCQRYDFRRIPLKTITELLADLCKQESFKVQDDALYAIAKASQGSLRDALSVLDQLSALSDRKIEAADVFSMLGLVEIEYIFELADALATKNCSEALKVLNKIVEKGKDTKQLTKDIIEHFRHLMIIKVGGKSLGKLIDYPVAIKERLLTQSQTLSLKEIVKAIDMFVDSQDTARITEFTLMPLEVAFTKLTYREAEDVLPVKEVPSLKETSASAGYSPMQVLKNEKGEVDITGNSEPSEKKEESESLPVVEDDLEDTEELTEEFVTSGDRLADASEVSIEKIKRAWDSLTFAVSREKMSLATFLQDGIPIEFKDPKLTIGFSAESSFQKESLELGDNKRIVENVFSEKLNTTIVVHYIAVDEYTPADHEPNIDNALKTFNGTVVKKWHNE